MHEIRSLTGVRGIAAFAVVLFHFGTVLCQLLPQFSYLSPVCAKGHYGVDFFFILSGFIISYVYSSVINWNFKSICNFILKRFARIYPVHLMAILILALLVGAASIAGKQLTGNYSLKQLTINLFMLQGFPIALPSWNYPSWSISIEFFGYLFVFPLTVFAFKHSILRSCGMAISLILVALFAWCEHSGFPGKWGDIFRISCEFASGAALYHGLANDSRATGMLGRALPYCLFATLAICFIPDHLDRGGISNMALLALCPLLIGGMYSERGVTNRILGSQPVRYIGLISYSMYMTHAIIEKIFKVFFPINELAASNLLVRSLVFSTYLFTPILAAACMYHVVEEPARKFIQRFGRRFI